MANIERPLFEDQNITNLVGPSATDNINRVWLCLSVPFTPGPGGYGKYFEIAICTVLLITVTTKFYKIIWSFVMPRGKPSVNIPSGPCVSEPMGSGTVPASVSEKSNLSNVEPGKFGTPRLCKKPLSLAVEE
ncbi:predicted protein [Histoplasma capsulatum H143]|uniref:Uncharacterized protein n=1 Tax=Ajellomyces capsulatus (strain H143) TaxID=544712 RepID=C6HG56_AJECH|nr:predicted protein [Histoplasma capsulatum H143]